MSTWGCRVAAIPPSAFYSPKDVPLAASLARFCFCKTEETLQDAVVRLRTRLPQYWTATP